MTFRLDTNDEVAMEHVRNKVTDTSWGMTLHIEVTSLYHAINLYQELQYLTHVTLVEHVGGVKMRLSWGGTVTVRLS